MNDFKEIAKAALDHKELLRLIYSDLAQPGVKQVGMALETVFGLGNTLLIPVRLLNEKASAALHSNMEKLRARLSVIPEEDIQQVAPEVGVPVLERLTYVTDDFISELFVELLSKASTPQNADAAHPAFISIIDNICPDEALLIKALSTRAVNRYGEYAFHAAKVDYVRPGYKNVAYDPVSFLLDPHILKKVSLQYPDYVAAYIQNLKRLGLIETGQVMPVEQDDKLNLRIQGCYQDEPKKSHFYGLKGMEVVWLFGDIRYTEFGRFFKNACFTSA
jgi:hypothetical protein